MIECFIEALSEACRFSHANRLWELSSFFSLVVALCPTVIPLFPFHLSFSLCIVLLLQ